MNSTEDNEGIRAMLILEIVGRPKEHIIESLEKIIKEMDNEKDINIISKKINEPVLMKDRKDFYTSFAEVEVQAEKILNFMILIFRYMPAHVEILYPEIIALQNNDWNDILSELVRRLHGYDEVARVISTEKMILEKKLRDMLENQSVNITMGSKEKKDSEKKITEKKKVKKKKK